MLHCSSAQNPEIAANWFTYNRSVNLSKILIGGLRAYLIIDNDQFK